MKRVFIGISKAVDGGSWYIICDNDYQQKRTQRPGSVFFFLLSVARVRLYLMVSHLKDCKRRRHTCLISDSFKKQYI